METPENDKPITCDAERPAVEPFQFGIGRLLILMTACAVLVSLLAWLMKPAPVGLTFRITVVGYFMLLTTYGVLRVPHIWRRFGPNGPRWRQIRQQRKELEAMASRLRDEHK